MCGLVEHLVSRKVLWRPGEVGAEESKLAKAKNKTKKNSLKCKDEAKGKFEPWTLKPHPFRRKIRQLLSIVLLCLRAPSELGSLFRHIPFALLLPTHEARKKNKATTTTNSSQVSPY